MQLYCDKCGTPQKDDERYCSKCNASFGGEKWVLILGAILILGLPIMLAFTGNANAILNPKVIFLYDLPILVVTACLYDSNPKRIRLYFFGGAALIVISLIIMLK
jgi:predicted nucleic acid-binding Zn ribbon protein